MKFFYLFEKHLAQAKVGHERLLVDYAFFAWPEAEHIFEQYGRKPYDELTTFIDLDEYWTQTRSAPAMVRGLAGYPLKTELRAYHQAKQELSDATDTIKATISVMGAPPALSMRGKDLIVADAAFWDRVYESSIDHWIRPIVNRRFMLDVINKYWDYEKFPPPTYLEALEELMPSSGQSAGRKPDDDRHWEIKHLVVDMLINRKLKFRNATKFYEVLAENESIWKKNSTDAKEVRRYFDRCLGERFPGRDLDAWYQLARIWKIELEHGLDLSFWIFT